MTNLPSLYRLKPPSGPHLSHQSLLFLAIDVLADSYYEFFLLGSIAQWLELYLNYLNFASSLWNSVRV